MRLAQIKNDEEILIDTNFSLKTMVKIANALESEFRCHFAGVRSLTSDH
jgi:hypothetical protein